jgi:hypothetical protein
MMRFILALPIFCMCFPVNSSPAKAERRQWAYEYLDACDPGSAEWPICKAYIEGFLDTIKGLVRNNKISAPFCLPDSAPTEQVAKAFKEFAEPWPYNVIAMEGALNIALSIKFPCRVL